MRIVGENNGNRKESLNSSQLGLEGVQKVAKSRNQGRDASGVSSDKRCLVENTRSILESHFLGA
jgi:hypothetical protein